MTTPRRLSPGVLKREAIKWMRFAERDLDQTNKGIDPYLVCWLSQQAAEKAIKAGLVLESVQFPRSHDLNQLRDLLPSGWSLPNTHSNLAELTDWASDQRYPRTLVPDPTRAEAQKALQTAKEVFDSIKADLDRRLARPQKPLPDR